jgi:hypothetical protein
MRVLYRITYNNGLSQTKVLISHSDYESVIKPTELKIYEIERANGGKPTAATKSMKAELKAQFGEHWFTDKSPLYYAMLTGILELPKHQGGSQTCTISKILLTINNHEGKYK